MLREKFMEVSIILFVVVNRLSSTWIICGVVLKKPWLIMSGLGWIIWWEIADRILDNKRKKNRRSTTSYQSYYKKNV